MWGKPFDKDGGGATDDVSVLIPDDHEQLAPALVDEHPEPDATARWDKAGM